MALAGCSEQTGTKGIHVCTLFKINFWFVLSFVRFKNRKFVERNLFGSKNFIGTKTSLFTVSFIIYHFSLFISFALFCCFDRRACFAFLCNDRKDFKTVLEESDISLKDKVAFALRFLADPEV
jgi:hypothetical protein